MPAILRDIGDRGVDNSLGCAGHCGASAIGWLFAANAGAIVTRV